MKIFCCTLFIIAFLACGDQQGKSMDTAGLPNAPSAKSRLDPKGLDIPVYDFEGLEPLLRKQDGKIHVVNFWATWCQPCIEELPHFERLRSELSKEDISFVLVSLDMPKMWESRLVPYVQNNQLGSEVVVLDDPKQNDWIAKIDGEWSGAIPATLIYRDGQRKFYETSFSYQSLKDTLKRFTKIPSL